MPLLSPARHAQGLASYRAGHSISHIFDVFEEIKKLHEQPGLTHEQHDEIENAGPSMIAGFSDGALEDLRLIASALRARRGETA